MGLKGILIESEEGAMNLREWRFKTGISQHLLQRDSGIAQSRISVIERGILPPTLKEKRAISKALHLNIDDIAWESPRGKSE